MGLAWLADGQMDTSPAWGWPRFLAGGDPEAAQRLRKMLGESPRDSWEVRVAWAVCGLSLLSIP